MGPNEYVLLINGELEAVVSEQDAKDAVTAALRVGVVTLAKEAPSGLEEISADEYTRLGL